MPARTPSESGRKSIFSRAALAITLLLVVVFAICEFLGWPFLREPFERLASDQLKREVRIAEPFQLRLIGGVRLHTGGLWISAPSEFGIPHFLNTGPGFVRLRYADLIRFRRDGQLRMQTLEVDRIDARLVRLENGQASWHFKDDPSEPRKPLPAIERLIATQGKAEVRDARLNADLKLDFSTDEGRSAQHPASRVQVTGTYQEKALHGTLLTDGFLPFAARDQEDKPIRSRGTAEYAGLRLDFEGTVADLLGRQNIDGNVTVRGPSLSVLGNFTHSVLPVTDKFMLRGKVRKTDEVWNVDVRQARIGESDLSGSFRYDPRPERPSLKGTLLGTKLYLSDLFPAFGTRTGEGEVVKPPRGKILADRPLDLPSLNKMDADIVVKLDYVDLGRLFARPIRPFHASLSMDKGKLALAKIDARVSGGALAGLISIDAHQEGEQPAKHPPQWRIDLTWKDIDLEKWLAVSQERKRAAKREGEKEIPPAYMTGMFQGRTKLGGYGNSTGELLRTLDGDVAMAVRNGTISHLLIELMGIDLAQSLGILIKGDESLRMQCSVMDFDAKNGIVTPQVALVDTNVTLVLIDGSVNLPEEELNLRLSAKPKNVSPFTLRSPIRVGGTFVNPKVRPEGGPIAARVAGSVALAFVNPLAALLPFVDLGGASDEPSPCAQTLSQFKQAR